MCWLFCTDFPVRTEGASSGLAHKAWAVTGWPLLSCSQLCRDRKLQSPQLLAEQCQHCAAVPGDHYRTQHVPSLARLCG